MSPDNLPDKVKDEPGMAERFERGLRKALSTPPTHRPARRRKEKLRSKDRVDKGNTNNSGA